MIVVFWTLIGIIIADKPTATSKLKIFEPIIFPIAISLDPFNAALILTAASGALVPNATIVSPISKVGIFAIFAIDEAPSTKKSAPLISIINPITSNT